MLLGAVRLNRVALLSALVAACLILVSCGSGSSIFKPPSGLTTRVFASQSVASPSAGPALIIINGSNDTLPRAAEISAGRSPGLMAISSDRTMVLAYDSTSNSVGVVNAKTESFIGSIPMPGPSTAPVTSMIALATGGSYTGYVAVPAAPMNGSSQGAVVVMNLTNGGIANTISVPNAQTVVASPDGTHILVFSNDDTTGIVTVISPLLVNMGNPFTTTVSGFDSPVYALFSADSSTAYVLNCGAECGGTQASVQVLNLNTTPPTLGPKVLVNGATIGLLQGSTLYVAGDGIPNGPLCMSIPSAAPTAAQHCGTLDIVDVTTMQDPNYNNPAAEIAITDGYHDRIDISSNGQLFIGSNNCTEIGNVNNVTGEVRGCLSIFNTMTGAVVIPPDNGDVTGLQSFTSRYVEYVAEGGNLRVYDTTIDSLLLNQFVTTGSILIAGQIVDVKAVDFF
jgi:hypothetical protein